MSSRPRIVLGCGNFGGIGSAPSFFGQGTDEETAFAIMDSAWARGIRWFDTADAYGGGRSESFIGRWRAARRPDGLGLTTKVFHSVVGDPDDRGLARDRILRHVDGSLERLGVRRIDLYLAHDVDGETPIADTVATFEELVEQSVVGAWGLSNFDASRLEEALRHGRPAIVQNEYCLLRRDDEEAVLPLCAANGIAYQAFGPLGGGWLTGKYRRGEAFPAGSRMTQRPGPYLHLVDERVFEGLDRLGAEAGRRGIDMPTLAIAWVLGHPDVASVVCGPNRPEHLDPVVAAAGISLSRGERRRIGSFFDR